MARLPLSFYSRRDVVRISRELLGKLLVTRIGGEVSAGIIIETEAYAGATDRASHAWGNRRTARTETMFRKGGVAYVYFCYGMHSLLNAVTGPTDLPHAVLIRAIRPTVGLDVMLRRRKMSRPEPRLASGPGSLTRALGIDCSHNGISLRGQTIWIEDTGIEVRPKDIAAGPRVGVDYAGHDASLPWRFRIATV